MKVLAVHSSSASLGIALVDGEMVLGRRVLPPAKNHLENLAPLIRDLMRELNMEFQALDGFGVAIGPGSFSGIRVGLAAVKGMALVLEKPVAGVSSLEVIAREGLGRGETGVAVIKAGRGDLYAAAFSRTDSEVYAVGEAMLIPGSSLGAFLVAGRATIVLSPDPLDVAAANSFDSVLPMQRAVDHSPVRVGFLAAKRLQIRNYGSVHSIKPLYIRRSEAEVKRTSMAGVLPDTKRN